jgi:two-component system chemotaxis response regulator CheB
MYRPLMKPLSATPPAIVDAIVIGTSTGGPNALSKVLADLPADLPVPILIVQHMPPVFTARLAERLNQLSPLTVREAVDGMKVEAGHAYLAPGDFHLTVARNATEVVVKLNQQAPECSCRPAVDVLFRSAANLYGSNLVAAVLTGMGQDGQCGSELIRQAGGWVIAQDQASSVVWGMPGAVSRAGLANEIIPLDAVGRSLVQQARRGLRNSRLQLAGV